MTMNGRVQFKHDKTEEAENSLNLFHIRNLCPVRSMTDSYN